MLGARVTVRIAAWTAASLLLVSCSEEPVPQAGDPSPDSTTSAPASTPTQDVSPTPTLEPPVSASPAPSAPARPRVRNVVVVSLDGMGSNVIDAVGLDDLPNLARLVATGASTLNARTEVEQTVTLPNHTGMMTGRPIDPAAGGHGVTVNGVVSGTVQEFAGEPVESVFDVVHDAGRSSSLFATEDKFALFEQSWPESIDVFSSEQDDDALVMAEAIEDLVEERRALTFIHLGAVDETGHAQGWLSSQQRAAALEVDQLVGDLLTAVEADRRLARRLVLVVTADHGGVGRGHLDRAEPRNFTVPFLVHGVGVGTGVDLYELNPQLADPGQDQPPYDAAAGPVRNGFVANLVTQLLGLDRVNGSLFATDPVRLCRTC